VTNSRKIKLRGASGQPLPECPDCNSHTTVTIIEDGPVLIRLEHDPGCPSYLGLTPSAAEAFAHAEAAVGRTVLAALSGGEVLSTSELAKMAGLHRHVARMRAEELEVIGVIHGEREGRDEEEDHDRRPVKWRLNGDDGQVIADVFAEHRSRKKWHEIWVTHSSTPQDQEEDQEEEHERYPNFVPPFPAGEQAVS
jgi:hypothetical protein